MESDEVKICNRQSLTSIIVEYLRLVTRNSNTLDAYCLDGVCYHWLMGASPGLHSL